MPSPAGIRDVAVGLLNPVGYEVVSCKPFQTLWAGYGHICSVEARPTQRSDNDSLHLILKYVAPPVRDSKRPDEGHLRKVISYQVEQHFYAHLAPSMPKEIAVASCLTSTCIDAHNGMENTTAMILSDLRQDFPVAGEKRGRLSQAQVFAAIEWLASFHGFWWTRVRNMPRDKLRRPPLEEHRRASSGNAATPHTERSVWLNGGYTYLATRLDEYARLKEDSTSEWSDKLCNPFLSGPCRESIAECAARYLSPSPDQISCISEYETLIHGDVKSENLFTTSQGDSVAFYDFQYVGLGLGVSDLAKLFTCSVPREMLDDHRSRGSMHQSEAALLRRYLERLETVSGKSYTWDVFVRHWEVALVDWLRFQASWGFWGNTTWLEGRVRNILEDQTWTSWLEASVNARSPAGPNGYMYHT